MATYLDYSTIITDNGEMYLHDENRETILNGRLERIESHYQAVRALLKNNELPGNLDNIKRVAQTGSDGLREVILDQTEREIRRLCIPSYLAGQFRRSATTEIPKETWEAVDDLASKISSDESELPIQSDDFIISDDCILKTEAIRKRISEGCRIRITDGMKAEAEKVGKLAKELREFELSGLNAIELVTKYARNGEDTPTSSFLFRDIVFRRHNPGTMGMDEAMRRVINETALKAAGII